MHQGTMANSSYVEIYNKEKEEEEEKEDRTVGILTPWIPLKCSVSCINEET